MGVAYSDLEDELLATVGGLESVQNFRQLLAVELDCYHILVCCFRDDEDIELSLPS